MGRCGNRAQPLLQTKTESGYKICSFHKLYVSKEMLAARGSHRSHIGHTVPFLPDLPAPVVFESYYAGCEGRSEKSDLKGGVCGRSFATSRICKIIFAGCSLSSTYVINLAGVQLLISLYNDDTLTIYYTYSAPIYIAGSYVPFRRLDRIEYKN